MFPPREIEMFVPATPRPSWWSLALGAALVVAVVIVGGLFNV